MKKNAFVAAISSALVLAASGVMPAFAAGFLTLNVFSGPPNVTVQVSGGGFSNGEAVTIHLGSLNGPVATTTTAAPNSLFGPVPVTIPLSAPAGNFSIFAVGDTSGVSASNNYYVQPLTPAITVTAPANFPGATITVSGTGFGANEQVLIALGSSSVLATADQTGGFGATQLVIPTLKPALYFVTATGQTSGAAANAFLYVGGFYPFASPSLYYILPGDVLNFTGGGFAPGETVTITNKTSAATVGSITADASGNFKNSGGVTMPLTTVGVKTFELMGNISNAPIDIMVTYAGFNSQIAPSSFFLLPGNVLNFTGAGFAKNETVQIFAGNSTTPIGSLTADTTGSFTNAGGVTIPFSMAGTTPTFTLKGTSSNTSASVTVTIGSFFPVVTPSLYYALPGQTISFIGTSFAPNETVDIIDVATNAIVGHASTTVLGSFSGGTTTIPFSWSGAKTLKFAGEISQAVTTLQITIGGFMPQVTPSAWYLKSGETFTVSGTGFGPNESVSIAIPGNASSSAIADQTGTFTAGPFTVPGTAMNSILVSATGQSSGVTASVSITVGAHIPAVTPSGWFVNPGSSLSFTGTDFAPGETVSITQNKLALSSTTASATGTIAAGPFTIPFGQTTVSYVFTGNSTQNPVTVAIGVAGLYAQISPSTWYASPGTNVTFSGTGFFPNENIASFLNGNAIGTSTVNQNGAFTASGTIPVSTGKTADFSFQSSMSGQNISVPITIAPLAPQVTPSTWYTPAGSKIVFAGTGFLPGEKVGASLNGTALDSTTTDSSGGFSLTETLPFGSGPTASFAFTGKTSGQTITLPITVAQTFAGITLSTYYALGGSPFTVNGMGFTPNETIAITFDGTSFGTTTADGTGAWSLASAVPYATPGSKIVTATGALSGSSASATFTKAQIYTISTQLGSYAGASGTAINFIGSGYLPNETINITTDRTGTTVVHSFAADANGAFNDSGYTTPATFAPGNLTLTITGAHSIIPKSIVYYVTGG